ncbi:MULTISPECIES: hypothetical protein [unclassified Cellulophaga]|uniref:hypothetical protein n=3 Tax=Cellulophaga TaxID=104264 RepID=UPI0026E48BC9|nr:MULTISPECIES: hypothetical protein [unclassified Cellulophaga]MDO6491480.1 hypothetical protein [Cellulophaga sp. 2_MG-2023]MDO6493357.1 hypothetical protein [Cellulophaga sp. 3_MG-2023]
MEQRAQIEKVISVFLFAGLFLNLFFVYFAQERLYRTETFGDNSLGAEKYIRILSVVFIFFTVFLSLFAARAKYKISVFFPYLLLLFTLTLNFLISGADISNMTHVMNTKGIGTWICLGVIFVSYSDKRYENFKKFIFLAAIYISILTLYNFVDFGIGGWRSQALSKYRVYGVNYIWIAPYAFLILKNYKKLKWLRVYILIIGIVLSLVIQTRSFLIIYFVTVMFDFFNTKKKGGYLVLLGIGSLILTYLVINTEILSASFDLLMNRGTHDSRTEQLKVFISQLDFSHLVTGSGVFASYSLGAEAWTSVDNQWLYLIWWGGLIPFLCYAFLSGGIPIYMLFRGGLSYETKVECFVLVIWFLGLSGLAIFSTMSVDLFFIIMSIILGRVLYKFSNNIP